jgi:hypothetical protein
MAADRVTEFVRQDSVVRRIWGDGDMVLLVFAGSAAEFALNRAVDWLFFTGKVPSDPIGRLFGSRRERSTLARASPATLKILAFLGADPPKCNSDGIDHGGHRGHGGQPERRLPE